MDIEEIKALKPTYIGPTWQRGPNDSWVLPQWTLGWQIAGWCAEWLRMPDGSPWTFTLEQLRFLLWWYAVDENGNFIYRKGVLQRLKGWGKDPLGAVLCFVELAGPCRFGGWDENGDPVGVDNPLAWVQVAAVSRDQTRNTMTIFPWLISQEAIQAFGLIVGAELIRGFAGRRRLEAVTSNPRTLEGGRSTFVLMNETHHWLQNNQGIAMYQTVNGNTTKMDCRYLAITNAYLPGEASVAEIMRDSWEDVQIGKAVDTGLLYDSIEAHPAVPLTGEALRVTIPLIRGDAVWLNVDAIIASIHDTSIPASRSRRMWLNQIVSDKDALYTPAQWRAIEVEASLQPGDEIVLGFDGGKTDDATALVAIRIRDRVAFLLGLWEKPLDSPRGVWQVDPVAVDSAVADAFRLFKVRGFYADVSLWESWITKWAEEYGEGLAVKSAGRNAIAWDMRRSRQAVTFAHERLMQAIRDQQLLYDGNRILRSHALNAVRRVNNYGVSFGKPHRESTRKVDAYAALMLAHEALCDFRVRGDKKERSGQGTFL